MDTDRLQKVMLFLFALLVFFIGIYLLLNTFVLNPITFHVKIEDRLMNQGEVGTVNSEIRNLAFYGLRDVSIESYIVMLDSNGSVVDGDLGKSNRVEVYSVGGFTAKVVSYDFLTEDLEKGRYRVYSFVNYTGNYNMPLVQDWKSRDFRII